MLPKHAFSYFISHGVPALISFVSIALFTRMLTPEEYGVYALIFATAAIINTTVFEWIKLSLLRYYQKYKLDSSLLMTIKLTYLLLLIGTFIMGLVFSIFSEKTAFTTIIFILLISWTQSWNSLNLSLVRAKLLPKLYGALAFSRATLGLMFGTVLLLMGFGEKGLITGLLFAFWITLVTPTIKFWNLKVDINLFNTSLLREFIKYGSPLVITLLTSVIIHNSDRFMVQYYLGTSATGVYSVTYDLTEQTLFTLMMMINLAAFPVVIRIMEEKGKEAAYHQVKKNTALILLIAVPSLAGFILIAQNIATFFLGESFRETAILLMPFIAIGAFIKGFKLYCIDIMYHLSQKTILQIVPGMIAAIGNIVLNIILIPQMGVMGAALATIISYLLAAIASYIMVVYTMTLPFPVEGAIKILLATLVMSIPIWMLKDQVGFGFLIVQVIVGICIYSGFIILFNVENIQYIVRNKLKRRQGKGM